MSYCEDYDDPFDREPEDDDWDCAYPGECLMGYCDHMRHECYTVEDMEEMGQ
jgi:hypothetical protein